MMKKLFAAALGLCLSAQPALADPLRERIAHDLPGLMEIYRDLHANPELSFQEVRTASILAKAARDAGFDVTENVGKTGVVAVLKNGDGPTILIRTDMDALPVTEQTGLTFASTKTGISDAGVETGIMHACGHDTHMTAWIETARLLSARRSQWSGTLVMIAQPAEEIGMGARAMLADGLYRRFPKPDFALAFHDSSDLPAGVIGTTSGYALANVDSVDVLVKGIGSHGAAPHAGKDPIVLASAIVTRLQTLVSRELDPVDPAVVTVGSIHGGSKHNIIPSEVRLQLTVRSYSDETRKALLDGIRRVAEGEAKVAGLAGDLMPVVSVKDPYTRSTYNAPELTERLAAVFRDRFGAERVVSPPPAMVGEDFGEYSLADREKIQGLLFRVGAASEESLAMVDGDVRRLPSLHSPFFAPDAEKVIATASEAMVSAVLHIMRQQ